MRSLFASKSSNHLLILTLLIAVGAALAYKARPSEASRRAASSAVARLSQEVSLHKAQDGNHWMSIGDGRALVTAYDGAGDLRQAMAQNQARPLALATGDFDKDGAADLIGGYAGAQGGVITLHRGNLDSIHPNSLEAQLHRSEGLFTDAPFLSPGLVLGVPDAPDFLGAGDFDADGNLDLVAASRGGRKLFLLAGDGRGGLLQTKHIELPGSVTALRVGEINRRDGLEDVAVCVVTAAGPQTLVFEGPEGALRCEPEAFALPAEASDLAIGDLNEDFMGDLVISAARDLTVIEGRDRRLSLDVAERARAKQAEVRKHTLDFNIRSVELGDFTGRRQTDVALLAADGAVVILSRGDGDERAQGINKWRQERLAGDGGRMVKASVSSLPADDLIVLARGKVRVITHTRREIPGEDGDSKPVVADEGKREEVTLKAEGEPVAALGVRLNGDALDDLVMLVAGQSAAVFAPSVSGATITVNSNLDSNERDSKMTLREAILVSNGELAVGALTAGEQAQVVGTPGSMDRIEFNITTTTASVAPTGEAALAAATSAGGPASPSFFFSYVTIATYAIENLFASNVGVGGPLTVQSCGYDVTPVQQNFTAKAGTGSITVTAGAGCGWAATSNAAFITITSGSSGTGNGTVGYSVQANTGQSRVGVIAVAGQTVTVVQAAANEWVSNGPFGGRIEALAIDPANTSTIYAGGGANSVGIFKSTNGGGTWKSINDGLTSLNIYSLAIDPAYPNIVYAGAFSGAFKSTNGGASWIATNNGLGNSTVETITIDPTSTGTVYVGTSGGGAFKSTNGGGNWSAINNGLNASDIRALAVDPANPSIVYAGVFGGVFKSTNGGGNWSPVNNGLTNLNVYSLVIDPAGTIYVGIPGGGVFKSTNGGGSWSAVNNGLTNLGVLVLAIDPANAATLYSATEAGVFKSTNGGGTWSAINSGLPAMTLTSLVIDSANTNIIYVGGLDGVFKSTSGGGNWNPANTGVTSRRVNTLVVDPANPNTLYAGTSGGGVFKSTNGGGSWSTANNGLTNFLIFGLAIDPAGASTLYAATIGGGVFKSTNGGGNWSPVNTGLTSLNAQVLAIDPANTNTIYVGMLFGGVFKSTNGGGNWSAINNGLTNTLILSLAIDPASTSTLYAGTSGGGVFKSTNGGGSWNDASNGLVSLTARSLAIDPTSTSTLYVGTNLGVSKSTDGGGGWNSINNGLTSFSVNALAIDPGSTSTLYAGFGDGGAFKSTNGGGNWSPVNSGLGNIPVIALAIDPVNTATLYAGTGGSVYATLMNNCAYILSPTSASFSASGGTGTVTVTTAPGCVWSASSNVPWIVITSGNTGTGNGTVSYSVAVNTGTFARNSSLVVAGRLIDISQSGSSSNCAVTPINIGQVVNGALNNADCISPIRSTGGSNSYFADRYSFSGTAGQQVVLSLSSAQFDTYLYLLGTNESLVAQDEDGGGGTNSRIPAFSGNFTLPATGSYTIEVTSSVANTTGSYTLNLSANAPTCSYSISPSSQSFASTGGAGSVTVTTGVSCAWMATSHDAFITITSGASGSGIGTVNYNVALNAGSARTGTLTIAGQTFTVSQDAGPGCTYSISPTSQTFTSSGGGGTVSVSAPAGCAWMATSNAAFIVVTAGASGSGNGTVSYSVTTNSSGATRAGTLTIAGRTFTVVQGTTGSGVSILLLSPLPKVKEPVEIDATTQPGYAGAPIVEINGSAVGGGNGLEITAGNSTVRGLTLNRFASNNRVSAIVLITNGNNVIENCYIGSNAVGTGSFAPFGAGPIASGIAVRSSSNNRIGGTASAARNLISGVDGSGIVISGGATGNLVQGNYIGTDITGNISLGNQRIGVYIQESSGNTIGGTAVGAGNLISGNLDYGVYLQDDSHNNLVLGNIIGLNGTGTAALPNNNAGVFIYNPTAVASSSLSAAGGAITLDNNIGGTTAAARNVISGNDPYGVVLGAGATGTLVQGNYIGANVSGNAAAGNIYGVTITQAAGSTVGGAVSGARNIISGNELTGLSIGFLSNGQIGGTGTTIQGNYIGTDASGALDLGNGQDGVFVEVNSDTHTIKQNLIAFNGGSGVRIPNTTSNTGTPGVNIAIQENSIYSNDGLGIDLGAQGVTPNDTLDADAGANVQQNFPVITAASYSGAATNQISVTVQFNSEPNKVFHLEFFVGGCTSDGSQSFGEVPLLIGTGDITTNGQGNANQTYTFSHTLPPQSGFVNCTATRPGGSTSEFSQCLPVGGTPPPQCSLSCTNSSGPSSATIGVATSFTGSVTPSNCTGAINYEWDFGDGSQHSFQQSPSHTYAQQGQFTWTLTANIGNVTCRKTGSVTVSPPAPSCSLSCVNSFGPSSATVGVAASFIGSASATNCAGAVSYEWDFGDGTSSTQQSPSHTYTQSGQFTWTLTARVSGAQDCIKQGTVNVGSASNPRTISLQSSDPASGVQLTVSPPDNSSQAGGLTPLSRTYEVGTPVTVTAPATTSGRRFVKWQRDGSDFSTSQQITFSVDAARTFRAVYRRAIYDLDGDGRSDFGYYANGLWAFLKSGQGFAYSAAQFIGWGGANQQPIVADFDGDGKADIAYIAPPTGGQSAAYAVLKSSANYDYGQAQFFVAGFPVLGDTPIVGDFDGDGKADPGIWRAQGGVWIIPLSSANYTSYVFASWGQQGNVPVVGDIDGDGRSDFGYYADGVWAFLKSSANFAYSAAQFFGWGGANQQPVVADFDGDGRADIAYIAPPSGGQPATYAILKSSANYAYDQAQFFVAGFPVLGDTPIVGDFDGDGKADPGIWRSSAGVWIIPLSSANYTSYVFASWGQQGNVPIPSSTGRGVQ